jgi:hypothetical protein
MDFLRLSTAHGFTLTLGLPFAIVLIVLLAFLFKEGELIPAILSAIRLCYSGEQKTKTSRSRTSGEESLGGAPNCKPLRFPDENGQIQTRYPHPVKMTGEEPPAGGIDNSDGSWEVDG